MPRIHHADLLAGDQIAQLLRRGKQLAIGARSGRIVLVHLGMTGQLLHRPPGRPLTRTDHVHLTWRLDDGSRLVFRDPRRFGGIWTVPDDHTLEADHWSRLGPDARTLTAEQLAAALAGSAQPLKARLLNQAAIAGLGNIYADEALFRAGLLPSRPSHSIELPESARLATSIREILDAAIEAGGSTLRDYLDGDGTTGTFQFSHQVYGRAGEPCRQCRTRLDTGLLAQRTTVWCPACQH